MPLEKPNLGKSVQQLRVLLLCSSDKFKVQFGCRILAIHYRRNWQQKIVRQIFVLPVIDPTLNGLHETPALAFASNLCRH